MLRRLAGDLTASRERERLAQSFSGPFFAATGRDTICYYENGRSVPINAELMHHPVDRRIHRQVLKWNDTGEELSVDQQAKILSDFTRYLDEHGITWEKFG